MKSFLCTLGILSVLTAIAQPKKPAPLPNTLLWEITGNGLTAPSYLFGTMHLLCAEDALLSVNLKKAIRTTERIFFEIDMDNMSEMMSALKHVRMRDNIKLSDLLTKEEFTRIRDYFDKHKTVIPFSMMERFKPYMITSLISESDMGCEKTNGMEMSIMQEANKYNREILGLETPEYQASLFDSIPYEKQAKELVKYVDSIDRYKNSSSQLLQVYREQNLQKMLEMTASEGGIGEYLDLLVFNRNRHWMERLNTALKEKPTLIAVGAGHLPGEFGMIQLLRNAGFTVKPLKNTPPRPAKPASPSI